MRTRDKERQKIVVRLVARGLTEKEIAQHLDCSLRAVQYDKARAAKELNIATRTLKFRAAAGQVET
jgi:DNA-binding CsgD family transcriptional regulator